MVAIARARARALALAGNVRILLMGEPFEGLSPAMIEEVHAGIQTLRGEVAIVIIEHCLDSCSHFRTPLWCSTAAVCPMWARALGCARTWNFAVACCGCNRCVGGRWIRSHCDLPP